MNTKSLFSNYSNISNQKPKNSSDSLRSNTLTYSGKDLTQMLPSDLLNESNTELEIIENINNTGIKFSDPIEEIIEERSGVTMENLCQSDNMNNINFSAFSPKIVPQAKFYSQELKKEETQTNTFQFEDTFRKYSNDNPIQSQVNNYQNFDNKGFLFHPQENLGSHNISNISNMNNRTNSPQCNCSALPIQHVPQVSNYNNCYQEIHNQVYYHVNQNQPHYNANSVNHNNLNFQQKMPFFPNDTNMGNMSNNNMSNNNMNNNNMNNMNGMRNNQNNQPIMNKFSSSRSMQKDTGFNNYFNNIYSNGGQTIQGQSNSSQNVNRNLYSGFDKDNNSNDNIHNNITNFDDNNIYNNQQQRNFSNFKQNSNNDIKNFGNNFSNNNNHNNNNNRGNNQFNYPRNNQNYNNGNGDSIRMSSSNNNVNKWKDSKTFVMKDLVSTLEPRKRDSPASDSNISSLSIIEKKNRDDTKSLLDFLNSLNEKLIDFVRTQKGSRSLQKFLSKITSENLDLIFDRLENKFSDLMVDVYGNYLSQKLVICCSLEQRMHILRCVKILLTY